MFEIQSQLTKLKQKNLWRELIPNQGLDFASNDYLGLAHSPEIRAKLIEFMQTTSQIGSTGSRLITGENVYSQECERMLAQLFKVDSALIFGSGYLANLGVMTALGSLDDAEFFSDEFNHASLIDGMRLTKKPIHIFQHNDLNHLENLLQLCQAKRKIIVTESVFSMQGDSPDLKQLLSLTERFSALLVLDEAHATGVCGLNGLGLSFDLDLELGLDLGLNLDFTSETPTPNPNPIITIHTCGKALGAYGAFVTSNHPIRQLLINRSRSFIYSTALSPVALAHISFAINEVQNGTQRAQLQSNIQLTQKFFNDLSLEWNFSHIGFVRIPNNEKALKASTALLEQDIQVRAIRSPTVATGSEGLRITLKSFHTPQDLQRLAYTLSQVIS